MDAPLLMLNCKGPFDERVPAYAVDPMILVPPVELSTPRKTLFPVLPMRTVVAEVVEVTALILPTTSSFDVGFVVPIPTEPET